MDTSPPGYLSIAEKQNNETTPRRRDRTHADEPLQTGPGPTAPRRSELLRWRLSYARAGVRTSPADTKRKKPHLRGWQNKATTNPQQITAEANRWPEAGILTTTGSRDRRVVLDVDEPEDLPRLEEKLGVQLRGATTEVSTQSGVGYQLHFSLPEGVEVPGSVGKKVKDGFEGLDVRGEGMMVLLPPTAGYAFAKRLAVAEAPPELIEWAHSRKKKKAAPTGAPRPRTATEKPDTDDGPILSGTRHDALASILGRAHDGSKSQDELTVLAHEVNASRCVPPIGSPGDDPLSDVDRIAESIYAKPPCRPKRNKDPEVEGLLERCSAWWYEELLPGGGRGKGRDTYRAMLMSAARRGEARTVEVDGEEVRGLAFKDATRRLAEVARASNVAVWKFLKRMMEAGALVRFKARQGVASTYVLLPPSHEPAHKVNSPKQRPSCREEGEVVGTVNPTRADAMVTPFYGWRNPWGDGGVEAAVEAFGSMTTEELAELFGISRVRDIRRRRLAPLEEMGVLVRYGDRWGLPEDHAAAVEERMREPYTTVTRRRRRKTTDEGRTVTWVDETVTTASENERDVARKAYHARERGEFVKMIQAKLHRIAVECFGGVDPETGEIVAERRDAPAPVDQEGVEKVHESSETPKGLRRAATPSERMGQGDAREGAESAGTGTEGSEASVPVAEPLSGPDNPLGGHTADTPATHPPGSVGGDLSDLARALSRWLERNPQDHPDCHPPGDRRMMRSGIESTLWAHNLLPPGRRYSREEVAEALQLGESFGRKDVAA